MTGGGSYETLVVERRGAVGWLVFDRPDAGNAMDARMFDELERAWTELDDDSSVAAIVNTGRGRFFQTGVDVVQVAQDRDRLREHSRRTRDFTMRFTSWQLGVRTPVIAAVNGLCAGGGLHFVADADLVVASRDAEFVDPHVSVGQVTAFEGITLVRKMPAEAVFRMALLGRHERMSATRACTLGMVGEVVEPDRLEARAQELGELLARRPAGLLQASKRAVWAALEQA